MDGDSDIVNLITEEIEISETIKKNHRLTMKGILEDVHQDRSEEEESSDSQSDSDQSDFESIQLPEELLRIGTFGISTKNNNHAAIAIVMCLTNLRSVVKHYSNKLYVSDILNVCE